MVQICIYFLPGSRQLSIFVAALRIPNKTRDSHEVSSIIFYKNEKKGIAEFSACWRFDIEQFSRKMTLYYSAIPQNITNLDHICIAQFIMTPLVALLSRLFPLMGKKIP